MKKYLSLLCAVVMLAAVLCGCTAPAYSAGEMENPKITLNCFVEAMSERDFDKAESCVINYTTLGFDGMEKVSQASADWRIYELLFDSYEAEYKESSTEPITSPYVSEDMNVNGRRADITFDFTSFNFEKMSADLTKAIAEIGAERMYYGETFETEEEALALVEEGYETVFKNDMSQYYKTQVLTVTAWYDNGEWKLEISDEFYSALTGR